ncbi:MAG TPA: peptide ABC transporter substrate-binding protein [Aggregatilinea sp.]|uniref:peptide ABC transporter substrate-binding protein n=1 Tax=Aggregatilinea sp. TaxID=2806333 RepID=UPI002C230700|nr:peptide ABC transporter substrate-binding protein [Aggregatilinea sp.]HML21165.1 peptide ABC transporter substrate-binding protein [Aggregatilinea sp.]
MKTVRRLTVLVLVMVLVLPTFAGVTSAQGDGKSLVTAYGVGDPHSIDPQLGIDQRDMTLITQLFPGLTWQNEESRDVELAMASSYDVSEDGKTYTFHLLEQVPWVRYNADSGEVEALTDDSGAPRYVTAADFVFGWTRALDPVTAAPGAYMMAPYITGAAEFNAGEGSADALGLKAVDDYTFEVTAPEAVGYVLGIYGLGTARPVPAWAIEESGDVWTEPENIATYGPFALKEWSHDESITFVKNPFWPGSEGIGQANVDELTIRFMDESVQLREFEAGGMDVIYAPATDLDRIRADSTLSSELSIVPDLCSQAWGFNTEKPPFDNVHIRRAFSYAVDRQSLIDFVTKGGEIPARWFTPPSISLAPTLEDNPDLGIAFDPEMAQQELALGLADLGLESADDLPAITVVFGNTELLSATAQALQVMWEEALGIRVELSALDTTTYWSTLEEDAGQIYRAGWCPDYNDANNYLRDVMRSDSLYNYGHWNSPEFDQIVDEARLLTDPEQRRELYAQAEQLMVVDEAALMPLYWPITAMLTQPDVTRTYATTHIEAYWKWDLNQ